MQSKDTGLTKIDVSKLSLLLSQNESATLEFKREWYKLDGDGESRRRQTDELIKDILALANGNAYSAGEVAFLIIGAGDKRNENGIRDLHDVGDNVPTTSSVLNIVRAASSPPLEDLEIVRFSVDGKRLFVVVIPPGPYLYETTRNLIATQEYSKHIVFMRRNESVDIASAKEREAIRKLKEIRFAETRNAPPILFGAGVGAVVGGKLLGKVGEKVSGRKDGSFWGVIVGSIMGGLFGMVMGSLYKNIMVFKPAWSRVPWGQPVAVVVAAFGTIAYWLAQGKISDGLNLTNKDRKA